MPYSTVPKTKRDGLITLIDGTTPAANELEVAYEDGNLSIDFPKATTSFRDIPIGFSFEDLGLIPGISISIKALGQIDLICIGKTLIIFFPINIEYFSFRLLNLIC